MAGEMITWTTNGEQVPGYLSLPEQTPAPAVIVLQEWWGLEPHIKDVADRFAAEGYFALAPDLYHGALVDEPDEARKLAMELDHPRAIAEIKSAGRYLLSRDDTTGSGVGIIGFCMGGGLVLKVAAQTEISSAAVVFYGRNPYPIDQVSGIDCPLLGIYGEKDQGIPPSEVERLRETLQAAGKTDFDLHIYPGAGHAFHEDFRPLVYRPVAAVTAWERTTPYLAWYLQGVHPN
jgi:carboxymethylenebutenolidase